MVKILAADDIRLMFGAIADSYDLANTVLSFGMHRSWRKAVLRRAKALPARRILDICCGTGEMTVALGRPGADVFGVDFSLPMLRNAVQKGLTSSSPTVLLQGDALQLPFDNDIFDLAVVSFGLRNLTDLSAGLTEIRRVLRPGASLLVLEFGQPNSLIWRGLFELYSRTFMPMVGGYLTGCREAYEYLPRTSRVFPCGERFGDILALHGFDKLGWLRLTGGIAYLYWAQIKPLEKALQRSAYT